MSSSAFIGKGRLNRRFLIRSLIDGGLVGVLGIILTVICSGLMTEAQSLATLFVMIVFGFASLAISNTSAKISVFSLLKYGAVDKRALVAILIVALSSAVITYIPFVNTAIGFEMPHPAALIAAVLTGLIPGVAKEIIKKIA